MNNQEDNNQEVQYQVINYNEESYANLTSQIQMPPPRQQEQQQQQQQNVSNQQTIVQNPPTQQQQNASRQSNRVRYQRMKFANQLYDTFMKQNLQKALQCPIAREPMTDPVIVQSGRTFQRKDLLNWIRVKEKTCPITRQPISDKPITNFAIKNLCQEYQQLLKKLNDTQTLMRRQNKNKHRLTIEEYEREFGRLTIDKKKRKLDVKIHPCQLDIFIYEMSFYHCDINDQGLEMFLQHGKDIFRNLTELNIEQNKITTINRLQRLPKLKRLYVGGNKLLSQECVKYLQHVNESQALRSANRRIRVEFKIQPL